MLSDHPARNRLIIRLKSVPEVMPLTHTRPNRGCEREKSDTIAHLFNPMNWLQSSALRSPLKKRAACTAHSFAVYSFRCFCLVPNVRRE